MSLLGFDAAGSATINGLTEVNANNVFSDVLYYDASTTPVNVKTAIDGITIDVTALEADVLTLQGEMTTAQSDINTLQSDMNTAQSDINTLQSDMNTAQSDIIALGVTVGATAVTVAALVVSQAAQDVTLATHTTQIGILQVDVNDAQTDISTLQTRTQHQSATGTKTAFSTKVEVGNVTLNTATKSVFGDGLQTDLIEGTGIAINATSAGIQTFAATSSLFQSTTTTTLTSGDETDINCTALNVTSSTESITIGSNVTPFTLTQTTGISPLTTVPPWTPTTLNVPADNPYDFIEFTIPFDLAVVMTSATPFLTGTITVTYNSITFAMKKNGVARTTTTEYYTEVGFTAGGARTWVQGSGITTNYRFSSYWGYFDFGIPIDTWNSTPDTYTIDITMSATATHSSGGTFTVQAIGVGQQITSSTSATSLFTQTYVFSPTTMTITPPTYPTYVAPTVNQVSTTGMTISAPNDLYVSNKGDATYSASNSLLFRSGTGYWTAQSSSNYYYQSPTDTYSVIHGNQTGTQYLNFNFSTSNSEIDSIANALTIKSNASILLNAPNMTIGSSSTQTIVPNGTLTKPFIIGTYASQSSYSTTTITPVTTYLGGTLESTKTFTNSATGNFRYIMASVTPFDANGAITLTAGTYMFWLAINFEDASVFNLTDLTMGLTTISTLTSASSEATIVASLPNLTCFFHKTDAGDAAASDSEQRVLSSCFRVAVSTTVYPFYFANHSVTVDTVTCNTVFVKIGGP